MIWMFRLLAILIVSGALFRAFGLNDWSRVGASLPAADQIAFREQLGFRHGVSVVAFVARPLRVEQRPSWQVAWLDSTGMITDLRPTYPPEQLAGEASRGADRLRIRRYRASDGDRADTEALPSQFGGVSVAVWDPDKPIYVTVGPDGQPGVAGLDDDGSGVVDDLSELGATGSDDRIVTPGQSGYRQAASGEVLAAIISRGAVVTPTRAIHFADSSVDIEADVLAGWAGASAEARPREVWLEFWPSEEGATAYRVLLP